MLDELDYYMVLEASGLNQSGALIEQGSQKLSTFFIKGWFNLSLEKAVFWLIFFQNTLFSICQGKHVPSPLFLNLWVYFTINKRELRVVKSISCHRTIFKLRDSLVYHLLISIRSGTFNSRILSLFISIGSSNDLVVWSSYKNFF